jgi:cold-inducible RNA-binding protein
VALKLCVGNLASGTTDTDLRHLFAQHGTVRSSQVIMGRETGRSKGCGFVEMDRGEQARAAMRTLNGHECNGQALAVNEARSREDRGGKHAPVDGSRRS